MLCTIYLIAPPNSLRHSLFVLLTALEVGDSIEQYDTLNTAFEQASGPTPDLTVLSTTTPDVQLAEKLTQIRIQWPHTRVVLLHDDEIDDEVYHGANPSLCNVTVVPAGTAAARLRGIFKELLCDGWKDT